MVDFIAILQKICVVQKCVNLYRITILNCWNGAVSATEVLLPIEVMQFSFLCKYPELSSYIVFDRQIFNLFFYTFDAIGLQSVGLRSS